MTMMPLEVLVVPVATKNKKRMVRVMNGRNVVTVALCKHKEKM
jgi:hypothetical protein